MQKCAVTCYKLFHWKIIYKYNCTFHANQSLCNFYCSVKREVNIPSDIFFCSEEHAALLKRSCILMCHEICHMFGLKHCIYYHCLMNGSNHDGENEKKPLHLCPVCLRKLHFSCNFNIKDRYELMAEFCAENQMLEQAQWFQKAAENL